MADVDLLFSGAPLATADLVFGDDGSNPASDALIHGAIDVGVPVLSARVALGVTASGAIDVGMPELSGTVTYFTDTSRPLVGHVRARWQDADDLAKPVRSHWQDGLDRHVPVQGRYQDADALQASARAHWADADRRNRPAIASRFQDGVSRQVGAVSRFQDALRLANVRRVRFERGLPVQRSVRQRFQDGLRNRGGAYDVRWQDARPLAVAYLSRNRQGLPLRRGWSTRYQEGIAPKPGRYTRPVVPPGTPCYTPIADLVFDAPWSADTNLVFYCEAHTPVDPEPGETVVVPIRRIYTVINTASLWRVDGDVHIPNMAMSLSIDVDSWTWGFSARVPGSALPDVEPVDGEPVDVRIMINGVAYRAIVEGISRDRTFARSDLTLTGRGRAAVLDAPYSAVQTFRNSSDMDTQQLANDVLTLNGSPIGWNIDDGWKPDNWIVPAGVFSHQGTYISALNAIANAAGAYLQPHRTDKALSVLRRYPEKPWDWGDVTPDFELPESVVNRESITWTTKPSYDGVYVRGMRQGVQAHVRRSGTLGAFEAPMITDALMTNAIGAEQRGVAVLGDTGRQALVSLRLPVLAETGVIPPGKFVRYVDAGSGETRIGLTRSVSAEVQRADKKLTIWQTIGVETHVL